jgi:hypothetical protein
MMIVTPHGSLIAIVLIAKTRLMSTLLVFKQEPAQISRNVLQMVVSRLYAHQSFIIIIIIMSPNQAIASTPSAPRPSGAEGRGSTAPLCSSKRVRFAAGV